MADLIGTGRCPIRCGSTKARYTLSAKGLVVATCNSCNCQVFARSDRSDAHLRENIIPDAAPEIEPSPLAADGGAAGPIAVPDDAGHEAKPSAAPPPPPPKPKSSWFLPLGRET